MKKYKTLIIILLIIAFFGTLVLLGRLTNKPEGAKPEMILFFGEDCPHCKNVDSFITTNNIRSKFKFQELEVYNNKDNAALLAQTAKRCGFDTRGGIGVPFFFNGSKCLQGDQFIIDFFKTK